MIDEHERFGQNPAALFTFKIHRGGGMVLLAMNWRSGRPSRDFVGFGLDYREPGSSRLIPLWNRMTFPDGRGLLSHRAPDFEVAPSNHAPIQSFRWVHMPHRVEPGEYLYRAYPVFMDRKGELNYGEEQRASVDLASETCPGQLNVSFNRGFVASHAFAGRYPAVAEGSIHVQRQGVEPSEAAEAREWLGARARASILQVLDEALADGSAEVAVIAHDLDEPDILARLERLGRRLRIIIDDAGDHGRPGSCESVAAARLAGTAGAERVRRHHLGHTQHNKTILVQGPRTNAVVCGSADLSWRGLYVRSSAALVLRGEGPVRVFRAAFENYWNLDDPASFGESPSARLNDLGLSGIDARVGFAPYAPRHAMLGRIADDLKARTTSSLFYSLGPQVPGKGPIRDAIEAARARKDLLLYGLAEKKAGGLELHTPHGATLALTPAALSRSAPESFRSEPARIAPLRMQHKFLVIDFDKPTARAYLGSTNFGGHSDFQSGEHLLLIRDRRVAVSLVVEALRLIDHYHFLIALQDARNARKPLTLAVPPRDDHTPAWWESAYSDPISIRDRLLFA